MVYLLAFLGGLILNLMPCVLPVLFLKAMSMQRRSWQYVAGVLSVFLAFGIMATTPGFVWGGQFNHAWFTWGTALVCFALGLTYLDVWTLPSFGCREAESDFGKGVLTTLLSSACSGPFLGAVFAASLTEPSWKIVTLFITIGAGFITPYLAFPRKWIPKPGAWMDTFKKLAGISMVATSIWLMAGSTWALVTIILLFWASDTVDGGRRLALRAIYVATLLGLGITTYIRAPYPVEKFDEAKLIGLMHQNKVVAVEFTSKYCLTCQWNESTMQHRAVKNALAANNVIVMQCVLPKGENLLTALGFTSVPVLAVFPGRDDPIVMPDVVTESQIIEAVEKAHARVKLTGSGPDSPFSP